MDIAVDDTIQDVVVVGDERLLTQAIVILLDNAIKYSPDKTTIHVVVAIDAQRAVIKVRDEGPGIASADQSRIFDRFYRVDQSRNRHKTPGHGLGLSIARKIVEQHNGHIAVESVPGRGATFVVVLPRLA
jgi:signal transduction histidine kinase